MKLVNSKIIIRVSELSVNNKKTINMDKVEMCLLHEILFNSKKRTNDNSCFFL